MVSDTFQIPLTRSMRRMTSYGSGSNADPSRSAALRSFYGGDENRLVELARQTLLSHRIDAEAFPYNPLLLCGGSGTGKSFLAHCFAGIWMDAATLVENASSDSGSSRNVATFRNTQKTQSQGKSPASSQGNSQGNSANAHRILLTTGADWARSFADAIRKEQVAVWRDTCRQASLFILDDVQQLFRRDGAQLELIQLMDEFLASDVPMIVTSPTQPALLDRLDKRLTSRLAGGLVIDLQPPSLASRKAIVREISARQTNPLSEEAIDWFTETYRGTVPSLQTMLFGALSGLATKNYAVKDAPVSKSMLRRLIESWESSKKVDLAEIVRVVSRYTRISRKEMIGSTRKQNVVQARSLAMYLAKEVYGYSLREIGHHFGGRDHTTVLHACKKIHERALGDPVTKLAVEELRKTLTAR